MTVHELSTPPKLTALYAKAAATARGRGGELPDTALALSDVLVNREHLAAYDQVCGFTLSDRLPATYLHVLAFPLAIALMADRAFPLPLPGLVHVANRITQHRATHAGERFRLAVRAQDLRAHPKGRAVDLVAEATVDGDTVWSGVSTYLRRQASSSPDGEHAAQRAAQPPDGGEPPDGEGSGTPAAVWRVPAAMGRRYASVSGDRNPIHLNALTARLFGFPRPIAHGMWTKARCLAALEGRLPGSLEVAVAFKAPLPLPSTVELTTTASDGGWTLALHAAGTHKPHLFGEVTPR